nr:unnamed protein product [Callosobruchus analis]
MTTIVLITAHAYDVHAIAPVHSHAAVHAYDHVAPVHAYTAPIAVAHAAPAHLEHHLEHHVEPSAPAHYDFGYAVVIVAGLLALTSASHLHSTGYEYPTPVVAFTAAPPHAHSTISSYSTHQHHDAHVVAAPVVDVHSHVHSDYGTSAAAVHGITPQEYLPPSQPYLPPSPAAHYDFGYSVTDPLTGDAKSQHETRRGDVVSGSYSLIDSDGTQRTVEYTADALHGFNAVVHKDPIAHPAHVVTAAPLVYNDGNHQAVAHHEAISHHEAVTPHFW